MAITFSLSLFIIIKIFQKGNKNILKQRGKFKRYFFQFTMGYSENFVLIIVWKLGTLEDG